MSPAMNSSLKLCCFKKQQIGAVQRVLASVRVRTRELACTLFYVYFYFSTCVEDTCCRDVENTSRDVEIVEMYRGARQLLLLSPIAPRQWRHTLPSQQTPLICSILHHKWFATRCRFPPGLSNQSALEEFHLPLARIPCSG